VAGETALRQSSLSSRIRIFATPRCSRDPFHYAAATATQILCRLSTHERLSGNFYFTQAFRIKTAVTFVALHVILASGFCGLQSHGFALRLPKLS